MILFLRSLLFHTVFILWTALWAVLLLWVFFLPRRWMVRVITLFFASYHPLEKYLLGLDYVVEGRENLPPGPCVIACQHQSAYETFKLHVIFGDVAIILKRELMWIPFWGWYQAKAGMIPVNRGAKGAAMRSMLRGARRVAAQGRPIVIFPQGTRVAPGAHRPYKIGTGVLAETLNLPVVPVALNAGLFWPRHAFLVRPGRVTFRILPPLPAGLDRHAVLQQLETAIERASGQLCSLTNQGVA